MKVTPVGAATGVTPGGPRLLSGVEWRTANIVVTVWIANECLRLLAPLVTAFTRSGEIEGPRPPVAPR